MLRRLLPVAMLAGVGAVAFTLLAPDQAARATGPDTWTAVASMTSPRSGHTATLLTNQKVLVAGGVNTATEQVLSSALLYDPLTNMWSSAGAMASPRTSHTATLLLDGRVLVAGGESNWAGDQLPAAAEIYNPLTNTWSAAGTLGFARRDHTATLLPDGTVLVAGGTATNLPDPISTAERYSLLTNSWSAAAGLPQPFYRHEAVRLSTGDVLLAGLYTARYTPATNTWTSLPNPGPAIDSLTLLADGRALGVGGNFWASSGFPNAQVFDPLTSTWSSVAPMPGNRYAHSATRLANGLVLVAGGIAPETDALRSDAVVYNATVNAWSTVASINVARSEHAAVLLADGKVLASGGCCPSVSTSEVYEAGAIPPPDPLTPTPTDTAIPTSTHTPTPITHTPTATSTHSPTGTATSAPVAPDLIVVSITDAQQGALCSQPAGVAVVVKNVGTTTAGASTTRVSTAITAQSELVATPALAAGESVTLYSSVLGLPLADTYTAVADYQGVVAESDESNNTLAVGMAIGTLPTCPPTPTFTPTVTPTATAAGGDADLIVVSITDAQSTALCTQAAGVSVVVKNIGSSAAGSSTTRVSTTITAQSELVATPALAPGESVSIYSLVVGLPVGDTYTAIADYLGAVGESDELNNTLVVSMPIGTLPTCVATLIPTVTATPPVNIDLDFDGVPDLEDNCLAIANPGQENADADFIDVTPPRPAGQDDITWPNSDILGDACDSDDDNDGLPDTQESPAPPCASTTWPTSPTERDTDGDRVLDGAECALGSDPTSAASRPVIPSLALDADLDRLTTSYELTIGTNPNDRDSDDDGLTDGVEVKGYNSNPLVPLSDADICGDYREAANVDPNTTVGASDLGIIASAYGNPGAHANFDIDRNGAVGASDLGLAAAAYGACP